MFLVFPSKDFLNNYDFIDQSKIKGASFTFWPNIIAFICEEGNIFLINIYSDEIFQEINIFPLMPNKIIFFFNEKGYNAFKFYFIQFFSFN